MMVADATVRRTPVDVERRQETSRQALSSILSTLMVSPSERFHLQSCTQSCSATTSTSIARCLVVLASTEHKREGRKVMSVLGESNSDIARDICLPLTPISSPSWDRLYLGSRRQINGSPD